MSELPASPECSELSAYFIASWCLSSSASFTFTRVQSSLESVWKTSGLSAGLQSEEKIFQNSDLMSWSPFD